jgi:purine-binding chemotaxis protein CheW
VEGVTNLRGQTLPVIDLRKRFGLAKGKETKDSRIVTVDIHGLKVGMVVDGVSEVLRVPAEAIEPPSPIVTHDDSAFITAIAKIGERLILVLDLGKVLTMQEQAQLPGLAG